MTAGTDSTRALAEEIASLRGELRETRRELAHVIAAMKRQDESQQQLRRDLSTNVNRPCVADRGQTPDAPMAAQLVDAVRSMPVPEDQQATAASAAERLGKLERDVDRLQFFRGVTDKELQHVRNEIDRFEWRHAWVENFLRQLEVWVHALAERFFPKAFDFAHGELYCRFPKGFAHPPNYLVPKYAPRLGRERKTPWEK
jgi:hypothetical protein